MDNLIVLLMMYVQEKDWIRACELYDIQTTLVVRFIIDNISIDKISDFINDYIIITGQDINEYRAEIADIERKIAEAYQNT